MTTPYLAPIKTGSSLRLNPMPNDGWVVETDDLDDRNRPRGIGAFSNSEDMLTALVAALTPFQGRDDEDQKP